MGIKFGLSFLYTNVFSSLLFNGTLSQTPNCSVRQKYIQPLTQTFSGFLTTGEEKVTCNTAFETHSSKATEGTI